MNLLSKTEKETLKKGFKYRFVIVLLFLISASFFVGVAMLLPSYFLTKVNLADAAQEGNSLTAGNEDSIKQILSLPADINSKLKFFQSNVDGALATDSFYKVISHLPAGVALNSISFSRNQAYNGQNGIAILVSGVAVDRDSLVSFTQLLKDSNSFSAVDVPVSSLAKDKNLPFSVNIFIKN